MSVCQIQKLILFYQRWPRYWYCWKDLWSWICKYTSEVRINTPLFLFHPPSIPPSQPLVVFHWTASSFILALSIRIQVWCSGKLSDLNKWQSLSVISTSYCRTLFFCHPWRLLHINDSGRPKNSSRLVELVQVMSDVCLWVCTWLVCLHTLYVLAITYIHMQTHRVHTANSGMQRQNNANALCVYANKPITWAFFSKLHHITHAHIWWVNGIWVCSW